MKIWNKIYNSIGGHIIVRADAFPTNQTPICIGLAMILRINEDNCFTNVWGSHPLSLNINPQ